MRIRLVPAAVGAAAATPGAGGAAGGVNTIGALS